MSATPPSPEFGRANPAAAPFFDLLEIPNTSPGTSPPPRMFAPIYPSPHSYSSSPPPITEYDIRIEKMSAVAIFVVLRLFPKGSVIGMDKDGNFTIYRTDGIFSRCTAALWRTWLGQNGDQLVHLTEPIKQTCDSYDPANKDVGFIFFIAYQGAQGLLDYYKDKDKPTVVSSLANISAIFLEHAKTCHTYNPISEVFRPQETLFPHRPYSQTHYQQSSIPTSAPIAIPKPTLTNLEVPFWSPEALEKFSKRVNKSVCSPATDEAVVEKRLQKLMDMINDHTKAFAARSYRSPYSGRH